MRLRRSRTRPRDAPTQRASRTGRREPLSRPRAERRARRAPDGARAGRRPGLIREGVRVSPPSAAAAAVVLPGASVDGGSDLRWATVAAARAANDPPPASAARPLDATRTPRRPTPPFALVVPRTPTASPRPRSLAPTAVVDGARRRHGAPRGRRRRSTWAPSRVIVAGPGPPSARLHRRRGLDARRRRSHPRGIVPAHVRCPPLCCRSSDGISCCPARPLLPVGQRADSPAPPRRARGGFILPSRRRPGCLRRSCPPEDSIRGARVTPPRRRRPRRSHAPVAARAPTARPPARAAPSRTRRPAAGSVAERAVSRGAAIGANPSRSRGSAAASAPRVDPCGPATTGLTIDRRFHGHSDALVLSGHARPSVSLGVRRRIPRLITSRSRAIPTSLTASHRAGLRLVRPRA
jgi:hypothetical protein